MTIVLQKIKIVLQKVTLVLPEASIGTRSRVEYSSC